MEGMKNIITLVHNGTSKSIECSADDNLLQAFIREGIYVSAACGGRGSCGKCRIRVLEGELEESSSDLKSFTEEQLKNGYRLACRAYPKSDCTVMLTEPEERDFEVLADFYPKHSSDSSSEDSSYVIAVDLGTTTIAISLVGNVSGKVYKSYTTINSQRAYGADVVSRIVASNKGKSEALRRCVMTDMLKGIKDIIREVGIHKKLIERVAISGNTTMLHLLMGYSCLTLGTYPFQPFSIKEEEHPFWEVFEEDFLSAAVILMPGISAFVGSDITAGLLACDFDSLERPCLFIDIGTNGEMAIGNRHRIMVSSTAAGPAFEGGNISCGVGSIAGAISRVNIEGNKPSYETIGDKAPLGICGTGVIETAAELLEAGLMDETGLLVDLYFSKGYQLATDFEGKDISITQKDIRELQLAKAAIRSGIELLLRRYGITYEDIDTVFLAGGFGYKMNPDKALRIGLFPKELRYKIQAVGNSALAGAKKYLLEEDAPGRMASIIAVAEELHLANDEDFNELYLGYMNF